jgi:hypothetical protein
VDVLSLLVRLVLCDMILLGLPSFEPVRFENTDEVSQLSFVRARF